MGSLLFSVCYLLLLVVRHGGLGLFVSYCFLIETTGRPLGHFLFGAYIRKYDGQMWL